MSPDTAARSRPYDDVLQQVLDEGARIGATSAEAEIGTGEGLSVLVRMGEVETVEHQRDKGLSVTVYIGQRKGSASTTDFSAASVHDTVEAACTIARQASEDPYAGLLAPEYLARDFPDLDLHHPWKPDPADAIALALGCEAEALRYDPRITNSDGASLSTYAGSNRYVNSNGFIGGWDWSSHSMDCTVIAADDGGMQRDGWYSRARHRDDMDPPSRIATEAARRAVSRLGARRLRTARVPVLYEAPVAGGLFASFINAISGGALYRNASFLQDRLGTAVFAEHVNINERPHIARGIGSAPFDNDGMATRERALVDGGILQGYVLSAYSARKLKMEPTGNAGGVHNLVVEGGDQDFDGLLRALDTGLLITDMIGFGVNQVTGDYSRGASGFWVENGEVSHPVEEITVAGNLKDMYRNIVAIGNDSDCRGNIRCGSVLIESMTVAGE